MVVISIKLSDGSVVRRRNENGSCSVNGGSVPPGKWKPRNVSAVRDFPPGCGPIVQPVNDVSHASESISSPVTDNHVDNGAGSDERVGLVVENSVNNELQNGDVGPHESEPPSSPVTDNHVDNDARTDKRVGLVVENLVNNELQNGDAVPHASESLSSPVTDNHVTNDAGTDERVRLIVENSVKNELRNGDVRVDNGVSVVKEAIPKMKFTRRRVSAVREFPPYCGMNADEPTEEERIRITGRRRSGTKSNESGKDKSVHKSQSNQSADSLANQADVKDGEIMKCESSKKVQNIGQACQELAVYARDRVGKKVSPGDNARDVDHEEDIRDNKPLGLIQKEIMNIENLEVGSSKHVPKRPLDATNNRVFIGDKIKVIMGLQAPSFCAPRIQEINLTNKAKGHAPITPKIPIKKKEENEEKVVGESSSTGKVAGESRDTGKVAHIGTLEKVEKDLTNKGKKDVAMTPKRSIKKKQKNKKTAAYTGTLEMVVKNEEDTVADIEDKEGILNSQGTHDVVVPPFFPKSSNDARNKVREILRYFHTQCRKLLQGEEAKPEHLKLPKRRVDLSAKVIMDDKGKVLELGKKKHGPIPGVEVGDEFQYRVELAMVGLHRPFQGGIDYIKKGTDLFAVSVVASGGYENKVDKPDCLMYAGSGGVQKGGNGKEKSYENQKLERGNLALKNNIIPKYPVRVIRGDKVKSAESSDSKSKVATTYIYDGLYTVETCEQVTGCHGNMEFRFELKRVPGQPPLAIREVRSKKFKTREGVCVKDISDGKEVFPICAFNTIDDEKPPAFTYITKIMYPDWYKPILPEGCDCVGRCSEKKCSCAAKNGGEIPYNHSGAIVEAKPLVYECGPACRCSRSCYNRVTQHGMKIHLEIFKTESRGWGVRSLSSISSGSFICEYIGELLEDREAEKLTGNDEYLFDIGQNYTDCSLNPDTKLGETVKTTDGFTIDALKYGNVGRFINHSCSPNLYAQNVVYDEDDLRMPHIMLFAAENIPPLQELTYHYNYAVNEVLDAHGNIKVKSCYCGSPDCTGRLY
ncbi:hypothetical protein SSX86_021799 [Deinandra increscens subsp. villosa]|uniref:Uncharacterized protein n=1 Tax=Deinandra increscens subsp. villosa TaxID=3103831 RepID=A0AAP0CRR6_9ASTR